MVPSKNIKDWLDKSFIRVDEKNRNIRINAEEVGEIANRVVSFIFCYKQ